MHVDYSTSRIVALVTRRAPVLEYPPLVCRQDPTQNVKEGQPVARVHVDYTVKSGPERLQALLSAEEVAELQKTPFAIIQVSL